MPEIPEYQRQNLKSSVVGTPGADFSTGNALDSIAQSTGQVSDAAYSLAVKRKEAKDSAVANESILSMDVEMENTWRAHQESMRNFEGDPKERASIFQQQAEKQVYERARLAPNEQVRRALMENGARMVQSRTLREIEAADKNQGVIAYTKVNSALKLAGEEAARTGADENMSFGDKLKRVKTLLDSMEGPEGSITAAEKVLNPAQVQELRVEAPASIMRAAATGMLAKKPEELLAILNMKDKKGKTVFDGKMKPEEIEKLRKEATDSVLNFKARKEREEVEAHLTQVSGAFDLAKKGDNVGALAMTEAMADSPLKNSMRQSILREGITEADRTDKVFDLMNKFETFMADRSANTKGEGAKKKVNMKTSLDELVAFQAEVIEAHATGDITDAKRNQYLTEFLPELQKKVRQNAMSIQAAVPDSQPSILVKAWGGIKQIAKDPAVAVTIHEDFRRRLTVGNDFSPNGVNKALIASLDEHRRSRFPKSIFLAGSVNAVLDRDKSIVATGIEGRTETPVSGKVPPATNVRIGTDPATQKKYRVTFDANNKEIKRELLT